MTSAVVAGGATVAVRAKGARANVRASARASAPARRRRRDDDDEDDASISTSPRLASTSSSPTSLAMRATASFAAAATLALTPTHAALAALERSEFYIEDVPQGLSSGDVAERKTPNLVTLSKGPNGKEIEKCAGKCIATCTRGGGGAPGLGPLSVRKAPVVFKEGFRSRAYCLNECTEICALTSKPAAKGGR